MSETRRFGRVAATAALAPLLLLALASCSGGLFGKKVASQPCPRVLIVKGADRLVRFAAGDGRDVTDVLFEAAVSDFRGECTYDRDEVEVDMALVLEVDRGPALGRQPADFEYFVALPGYYPQEAGRKAFAVRLPFGQNQRRLFVTERLELTIPLKPGVAGPDHEILIGLKLSREEIDYNARNVAVPR